MKMNQWVKEFGAAVTVCDKLGMIIEMNDRSVKTFAKEGGEELIGSNVLKCHPKRAREKLVKMLRSGKTNVYTIEKGGIKKLIYQAPWYKNGKYAGFVELSLPVPENMPHFVR